MMSEVMTIGEAMALFVADKAEPLDEAEHFTKFISGAELNVCIGLSRLGHKVSYITSLGDDPFGKFIYKFLAKEKIDSSFVRFDKNNATGCQIKEKVLKGDPLVVSFRKDSAASHVTKEDIHRINFDGVRHVHVTGIFPALSETTREAVIEFVKEAKKRNITVTFDPNIRTKLWKNREAMIKTINEIASFCDIILPGVEEGFILTGSRDIEKISDFYLKMGAKCVITKNGAKGAHVNTKDESFDVPGFKVDKVVDTVGAGDGFAVGVISALLEGCSYKDAALRGNAIGSLQVMSPGDNDGLPSREKLFAYMNK